MGILRRFLIRRKLRWAARMARLCRHEPRYREKVVAAIRAQREARRCYRQRVEHPRL